MILLHERCVLNAFTLVAILNANNIQARLTSHDIYETKTRGDHKFKIINGTDVANSSIYPFYVTSPTTGCGGSLIGQDVVLTAAHCPFSMGEEVIVGAYNYTNLIQGGAESRIVTKNVRHPDYRKFTHDNDFRLMFLDEPVTSIDPIELNFDSKVPQVNEYVRVIGLGNTNGIVFKPPDVLQEADVPVLDGGVCAFRRRYWWSYNDDVEFCAGYLDGGTDSCQGDSGGPVFSLTESKTSDKLVGVVSWGIGCALEQKPGVYGRVSGVEDWIKDTVCANSAFPPFDCDSVLATVASL